MADIQDWPKFTEFQETEPMETTSGGGGDGGMQGIKSKVCNITYNSNKFITFHIILTIPSHFQYSSLQPYRLLLPQDDFPSLQEAAGGTVRPSPGNILHRTVFMQSEQVTLYFNLSLPHLLHLYVSIFRDRYELSSNHWQQWKRWNTTPTMRRTTCHSTNYRRRS